MNPHCIWYQGPNSAIRDVSSTDTSRPGPRRATKARRRREGERCVPAWPSTRVSRLTYRVWFIVIVNDRVYPSIHGAAICPATCLTAQCTSLPSMLPRVAVALQWWAVAHPPTREKSATAIDRLGPFFSRPITTTNKQDGQFSDPNELRLSAYILIDGAPRLRM